MSFILDALRKSENERQRGTMPSISRVPTAAPPHRLPTWAIGVMLALAAALIVLSGVWWRGLAVQTPDDATLLGAVAPSAPASADRLPAPAPRSVRESVALSSLVREPTPAASAEVANTGGGAAAGGATVEASAAALPTAGELAARGVILPRLALELHVFSENPAQRFVFINAARYREGDTLAEGPRVLAITPAGAVLSHQGREFVLGTD